jgi:hypothetical protein
MSDEYDYTAQIQSIQESNAQIISQYFSSVSTTTSSSSSSSSSSDFSGIIDNLKDYGLIKTGAYTKLMKAYYNNLTQSNADSVVDSTKSLVLAKDDAKSLKSATNALNALSFDKVEKTTKDDDGNETTTQDYDWDSLYKAAQKFVTNYNSTIDSVSQLNSTSLLKTAVHMVNQTEASQGLLEDIGITIGDDNKLSIDEDTFKESKISDIKTLFSGSNSYAAKIGNYATSIYNISANAALTQSTGGSRVYTQAGSYSDITTSTLYDSLL